MQSWDWWGCPEDYKHAYQNGYDIAIQFDADGQHNEDELEKIIQPIVDGQADFVIGSRFLLKTDYQGNPLRRIGI